MEEADPMALEEFFDLRTPEHLLRKLEREYERWQADPVNSDFAWNFFVTAEHLPDWIYHQEMPTSGKVRPDLLGLPHGEPRDFRLSQALTRLCSHLASGGKHFYIKDRKIKKVVQHTERENTSYFAQGYFARGYFAEPYLRVSLTAEEAAELELDTADVDALWLATKILVFWRDFPVFQSPEEPLTP
jgi:hypothetical protein